MLDLIGMRHGRPLPRRLIAAGRDDVISVGIDMRPQHHMPGPKDRSLASFGHGLCRNDIDQFGCAHDDRFDVGTSKGRLNGIRRQRERFEIGLGDVW